MSGKLEALGTAEVSDVCEIVTLSVGPLATAGEVEVATRPAYLYEVEYGKDGNITGAHSWKYNAETEESTYSRFDATGKQLSRYEKHPAMGTDFMYDGDDKLVSSSHTDSEGKIIERYSYGDDEQPISSSVINRIDNTHTMTLFQNDGTQFVRATQWEGPEGWTSTAYPPTQA
jgi:hypothetical protein